jgi:hypothetical protein
MASKEPLVLELKFPSLSGDETGVAVMEAVV